MKTRYMLLALLLGASQAVWAEDAPTATGGMAAEPAASEMAPAAEPAATEMAPMAEEVSVAISAGRVDRSTFTSAVENREPVDSLSTLENSTSTVYFFTELRDMQGQTAVHRWSYNGNVMAEVSFPVGGARWRVFSSKNLIPEWVGTWQVEVLNANGEVIDSKSLTYTQAAAPVAEPAAATDMGQEAGVEAGAVEAGATEGGASQ